MIKKKIDMSFLFSFCNIITCIKYKDRWFCIYSECPVNCFMSSQVLWVRGPYMVSQCYTHRLHLYDSPSKSILLYKCYIISLSKSFCIQHHTGLHGRQSVWVSLSLSLVESCYNIGLVGYIYTGIKSWEKLPLLPGWYAWPGRVCHIVLHSLFSNTSCGDEYATYHQDNQTCCL